MDQKSIVPVPFICHNNMTFFRMLGSYAPSISANQADSSPDTQSILDQADRSQRPATANSLATSFTHRQWVSFCRRWNSLRGPRCRTAWRDHIITSFSLAMQHIWYCLKCFKRWDAFICLRLNTTSRWILAEGQVQNFAFIFFFLSFFTSGFTCYNFMAGEWCSHATQHVSTRRPGQVTAIMRVQANFSLGFSGQILLWPKLNLEAFFYSMTNLGKSW